METQHAHSHSHFGDFTKQTSNRIAISLGLTLAFVGIEALAGIWGNSLALLSDAGHNLTDVLTFGHATLQLECVGCEPDLLYCDIANNHEHAYEDTQAV